MLGRALTARLAPEYTVVGADVAEPPAGTSLDSVHYMDVTSDMSVREALEAVRAAHGRKLAAVVHLAAFYDFSGADSPLYDRVTVKGTDRLLRHLDDFEVHRFVFSSTMLVHGPVRPGQRIDEDSPIEPRWPYPESKMRTEHVIVQHEPAVPYTLLRIAGVYTDWGSQPTLVEQIRRIHEQDFESFFFPGDSEAGQSLVHLDDAVDAIARTIDRRDALTSLPILIGEPDPPAYAELQDRIGERLWGEEWPTIRVPAGMAKAAAWVKDKASNEEQFIKPFMIELADDHYALDVGRARRLLGWEPRHRLQDELPGILQKLREDPARWYRHNGLDVTEEAVTAAPRP